MATLSILTDLDPDLKALRIRSPPYSNTGTARYIHVVFLYHLWLRYRNIPWIISNT
eukprot:Gb_24829 [translate_table: standard]